jgi:hypothetical protein
MSALVSEKASFLERTMNEFTDSTETPSIRGAHIRLSIKHMRTPRIRLDNRQPPKRHVQRALRQHGAYARSKAIK